METEYLQSLDEGRDVAQYKEACAVEMDDAAARVLAAKMAAAPLVTGYPYAEPSDFAGIQSECAPIGAPHFEGSREELANRIKGAFAGRIAGCLLGKPVEGKKRTELRELLSAQDNYPLRRYIDLSIADGAAPVDDDTNYTVFYLRMAEKYGRNFLPMDCLEGWIDLIPGFDTCTAERVAYRNGMMGLLPPFTASFENPFREWIGAEIRADLFGYINPGNPGAAAEMAWRDASISHVKNGIYGEMFSAALIAAAATVSDMEELIVTALSEVPKRSRLFADVSAVLSWYREGKTAEAVIDGIHARYTDTLAHHWCHTNSNVMVVVYALLFGEGDLGKSICLAVQDGFDTDCNGATVGSVVGMLKGLDALPREWLTPYSLQVRTSISGDFLVTVDDFARRALALIPAAL